MVKKIQYSIIINSGWDGQEKRFLLRWNYKEVGGYFKATGNHCSIRSVGEVVQGICAEIRGSRWLQN